MIAAIYRFYISATIAAIDRFYINDDRKQDKMAVE